MNNITCYINNTKYTLIIFASPYWGKTDFSIHRYGQDYYMPISILKTGIDTVNIKSWTSWYKKENLDDYKLALQKFEKCMTLL